MKIGYVIRESIRESRFNVHDIGHDTSRCSRFFFRAAFYRRANAAPRRSVSDYRRSVNRGGTAPRNGVPRGEREVLAQKHITIPLTRTFCRVCPHHLLWRAGNGYCVIHGKLESPRLPFRRNRRNSRTDVTERDFFPIKLQTRATSFGNSASSGN